MSPAQGQLATDLGASCPRRSPRTVLPPSVQSGTQAGFVGAVRSLVAALQHCSSRPQSPRPLGWVRAGRAQLQEKQFSLLLREMGGDGVAIVPGKLFDPKM